MADELLLRRLRIGWHDDDTPIWVSDAMTEAAARIEQLKAQNMRLSGMVHDLNAHIQASNELGKALEEDAGQLREENARLRELLEECAEDLGAYVNNEYPAELRNKYPALEDKYSYFMEPVLKARAALKGETP